MTEEKRKEEWINFMRYTINESIQYYSSCLKYDLTYIKIYNAYLIDGNYKSYWAIALMD